MKLLSRTKKTSPLGYATALFGLTLVTQLFHAFNLDYYTNTGMVNMKWATICKIIFVVVDWLNDIIFGALSEHTKSKYGKRIPWLLGGLIWIPALVSLTYFITPEAGWSPGWFVFYYIFISVTFENASTVIYTNYNALYPTLFTTTAQRTKTSAFKHILECCGLGACYLLTPILRDECDMSYFYISLLYMGVYLITFFIFFKTLNVEDDLKAQKQDNQAYFFKDAIKDCFKDKGFVLYNLASSFSAAVFAILVTIYPMYCRYVLNAEGFHQAVVFGCFFITILAFIPLWNYLINRFGFVKIWLISYIVFPLTLFLFLIPQGSSGNYIVGSIICALVGPFYGGLLISPDMMFAEIIDIDRLKHHVSREAALGSIGTLVGRISVILAAIVTAILTTYFGFESGTNPGPDPELTFRVAFGVLLPVIGILGSVFAILYVKVSKKDRMVLHELKRNDLENTTEVNISEVIAKANPQKAQEMKKTQEEQKEENLNTGEEDKHED